jgi:hypothetical protein
MTDPGSERKAAVAALLSALREVRDVNDSALRDIRDANERLQLAAAWIFEAFGDTDDAETIRMLPVGPARPGRPAVPPPARGGHLTDTLAALAELDPRLWEPLTGPDSVTRDETAPVQEEGCACGHPFEYHHDGRWHCVAPDCDCSKVLR